MFIHGRCTRRAHDVACAAPSLLFNVDDALRCAVHRLMYRWRCADTCVGMFADMPTDMCLDMSTQTPVGHVLRAIGKP